jgi:hypothetical protein
MWVALKAFKQHAVGNPSFSASAQTLFLLWFALAEQH